ncbi:hypothetical protein EVJ50_04015 [Synechococcus sp. RSCCF101]|uniref:DUF5801 repeats-in-toxin domain-containing protein n=1 Tax=Synechococcus sp. RSCCF101 TaxID=2511069 RepID=UPI0012465CB3|nr:DUF5801 repeats-in-toxin domain-containing protein [Synechococcus sp. RSCCF101]QEY31541.1 hypothetical protein EVJ50_04015 [Synechococcus sp. RSCCF101]
MSSDADNSLLGRIRRRLDRLSNLHAGDREQYDPATSSVDEGAVSQEPDVPPSASPAGWDGGDDVDLVRDHVGTEPLPQLREPELTRDPGAAPNDQPQAFPDSPELVGLHGAGLAAATEAAALGGFQIPHATAAPADAQTSGLTGSPEADPQPSPGTPEQATPGLVPQPTPGMVPELTPGMTPGLVPEMTPGMTPGLVPQPTPGMVPELTPGMTPGLVPEMTPGMTPGLVPQPTPGMVPELTPGMTPGLVPDMTPGMTPGLVPQPTPGMVPELTPGMTPGLVPDMTPGMTPGLVPQPTPGMVPELTPGMTPGLVPDMRPGMTPGLVPQPTPGMVPELTPGMTPGLVPDMTPGMTPGLVPQPTPGMVPELTPGMTPGLVPDMRPGMTPGLVPQPTPGMVPELTPGMTPGLVPDMTPGMTPGLVPQPTPGMVPELTPGMTPGLVPDMTPGMTPGLVPQPTPGMVPELTPGMTPGLVPDMTPGMTPGLVPQPTPGMVPELTPGMTPGLVPDMTPGMTPGLVPQPTPGMVPELTPGMTPGLVPDMTPGMTPGLVPQPTPGMVPELTPGMTPGLVPDMTPGMTPGLVPQPTPGMVPELTPGMTPGLVPDMTPGMTPGLVPQPTPGMVPELTPGMTPGLVPDMTPGMTPGLVPQPTPGMVPELTPGMTPGLVPDMTPGMTPGLVPQPTPGMVPELTPGMTPGLVPDMTPGMTPGLVPQPTPGMVPELTPGMTPGLVPDMTPGMTPGLVPQPTPGMVPELTPGMTPGLVPDMTPGMTPGLVPQPTPGMVPELTPGMTPGLVPDMTPGMTPGLVPQPTPGMVPELTPGMTPGLVPDMTPGMTPGLVPQPTPGMVPELTPGMTPGLVPDMTPGMTPGLVPQPTPGMVPELTPGMTPGLVPDMTPGMTPGLVPQPTPGMVPELTPGMTPGLVPDMTPGMTPGLVPQPTPGMVPELTPGMTPGLVPDMTPGMTPGLVPQPTPGMVPELTPGMTPGLVPDMTPGMTPGLVPQPTPGMVPELTPGMTPGLVPDMTPGMTPGLVPQPTPGMVPELTPGMTPGLVPDMTPGMTPGLVPQPTPGMVPELTPGMTPGLVPDMTPGMTPGLVPQPTPGMVPQATPGLVPDLVEAMTSLSTTLQTDDSETRGGSQATPSGQSTDVDQAGAWRGALTQVAAGQLAPQLGGGSALSLTRLSFAVNGAQPGQGVVSGMTSNGQTIYLHQQSPSVVVGSLQAAGPGTSPVFVLDVDAAGHPRLTQLQEIDHPDTSNVDEVVSLPSGKIALVGEFTGSHADQSPYSGSVRADLGGHVSFRDDGPSVIDQTIQLQTQLETDDTETAGGQVSVATDPTGAIAQEFARAAGAGIGLGADAGAGAVAASVSGYGLSVKGYDPSAGQGVDSGLTQNGQTIYLHEVSGGVVGSTEQGTNALAGANTVFAVRMDGQGRPSLIQVHQIDHPDTGSTDEAIPLGSGLVEMTAQVSGQDADGDPLSGTIRADLGSHLSFRDDGPSVIDQTIQLHTTLETDDTDIAAGGMTTATDPTGAIAQEFARAAQTGFSLGADDGAPAVAPTISGFGLTVKGYDVRTMQGVDSGLTQNGQTIYLHEVSGGVVGSTEQGTNALAGANTVFAVRMDGQGRPSLIQVHQIDHPDTGSTDEAIPLGSGLVEMTAQVSGQDADGDPLSGTIRADLGSHLSFRDDGPSVIDQTIQLHTTLETDDTDIAAGGMTTATDPTGAIAQEFARAAQTGFSLGADDGAPAVAPTISGFGLTVKGYDIHTMQGVDSGLTQNGQAIYLHKVSGGVVGSTEQGTNAIAGANTVFAVRMDGQGRPSLIQVHQIDHPNTGSIDEAISLGSGLVEMTAQVSGQDADGDPVSGTIRADLGTHLSFRDDGPSVIDQTIQLRTQLETDDSDVAGGGLSTATDHSGLMAQQFAQAAQQGVSLGADDGSGAVVPTVSGFGLAVKGYDPSAGQGVDSGLTQNGQTIYLHHRAGFVFASTAQATSGLTTENTVFNVRMDGQGRPTLIQTHQIDHPNTASTDEPISLRDGLVEMTAQVSGQDADGDPLSGTIRADLGSHLSFRDDGPEITQPTLVHVEGGVSVPGTVATTTGQGTPPSHAVTTHDYGPHQNIGLVLDYSGSMWETVDGSRKADYASHHAPGEQWGSHSHHHEIDDSYRISQQLESTASTIKQALTNAGYKVTTGQDVTDMRHWHIETPGPDATPGNVHIAVARFGTSGVAPHYVDITPAMVDSTGGQHGQPAYAQLLGGLESYLRHKSDGSTNHAEAWDLAHQMAQHWRGDASDPLHPQGAGSGVTIGTDTNLLFMTDGQTTTGDDVIPGQSVVLAHDRDGRLHDKLTDGSRFDSDDKEDVFNLIGDRIPGWSRVNYDHSSSQRNHRIDVQFTRGGSTEHVSVTAADLRNALHNDDLTRGSRHGNAEGMAVRDGQNEIVGWLTLPQMHHGSGSDGSNPLVFVPNQVGGVQVTGLTIDGHAHAVDTIHDLIARGQYNSEGVAGSEQLQSALDALNQEPGHRDPLLLAMGLTGSKDELAAQLEQLFSGSLPKGSVVETVTDAGGVAQQIQHVVAQHVAPKPDPFEASWAFTYDMGADDGSHAASASGAPAASGHAPGFQLALEHVVLATQGATAVRPFTASFDASGQSSNVQDHGNGQFEITVPGLGSFDVRLGSDFTQAGSRQGAISFHPLPGVHLPNGLQDLKLTISDGDQDRGSTQFSVPAFDNRGVADSAPAQADSPADDAASLEAMAASYGFQLSLGQQADDAQLLATVAPDLLEDLGGRTISGVHMEQGADGQQHLVVETEQGALMVTASADDQASWQPADDAAAGPDQDSGDPLDWLLGSADQPNTDDPAASVVLEQESAPVGGGSSEPESPDSGNAVASQPEPAAGTSEGLGADLLASSQALIADPDPSSEAGPAVLQPGADELQTPDSAPEGDAVLQAVSELLSAESAAPDPLSEDPSVDDDAASLLETPTDPLSLDAAQPEPPPETGDPLVDGMGLDDSQDMDVASMEPEPPLMEEPRQALDEQLGDMGS